RNTGDREHPDDPREERARARRWFGRERGAAGERLEPARKRAMGPVRARLRALDWRRVRGSELLDDPELRRGGVSRCGGDERGRARRGQRAPRNVAREEAALGRGEDRLREVVHRRVALVERLREGPQDDGLELRGDREIRRALRERRRRLAQVLREDT